MGPLYGHFGQGCVHTRLTFDLQTPAGIAHGGDSLNEAADLVVRYGGSLSGEHGDGQARGELLAAHVQPEMIEAFREFKAIWDPDWKMNPGKVDRPISRGREPARGRRYHLPPVSTHFHFPDDRHSFAAATDRCVGAGVCRRHERRGHDVSELHGDARREALHARPRAAAERNDPRRCRHAADGETKRAGRAGLCLSCKGCKHDCPVQVDMATYKAEFLSHYYERRLRPRYAYASGLIYWWARAAAHMPADARTS